MKKIIILYTFLISCSAFAQQKDIWTAFWNKDTTQIGFKDKTGIIKIEPKFSGFIIAKKFEDIIAAVEVNDNHWDSYYLTKSGKIIGSSSLYSFDNGPDCESEGFIRFTDYKIDKMGMFNGEGNIVIPTEYSNLSRVRNGMILALKDAVKEQDGEHFFWIGGKEFLIDINNKILIENFKDSNNLNFYSLEKSKEPSKDKTRENFIGVDGLYYSFVNYEKEFQQWLKKDFLNNLSKANLEKHSFGKITYWKEPDGWVSKSKSKFIDENYNILKLKLQQLTNSETEYFISSEGLNQFIFESDEYALYFNNCNESKNWMYPTMDIIISPKRKTDRGQDHFEFLRTENGYKLISVSTAKNDLK